MKLKKLIDKFLDSFPILFLIALGLTIIYYWAKFN